MKSNQDQSGIRGINSLRVCLPLDHSEGVVGWEGGCEGEINSAFRWLSGN